MTDGIRSVLARMNHLDRQIRAVDPAWGGVSGAGTQSGVAGVPAWAQTPAGAATGSFDSALAVVDAGYVEATARAGARAGQEAPTTATASPAIAAAALTNADGSPAWAIPASRFHALPATRSESEGIAASGRVTAAAGRPAGGAVRAGAYTPPLVSERIGAPPYTDCSWASITMLLAKASNGATPTTAREVLALRAASGDRIGGSTTRQNINAVRKRYGFGLTRITSQADALARLSSGWGAKLNLTFEALPEELRRWDPGFAGGHSVYVQDFDAADGTLLWMDPMAPVGSKGQRVRVADIAGAIWWSDSVAAQQGSLGD